MFYDTTEPHPQHLKVHKRDFKQNFYLFVLRACVEVKMYHGKRVAIGTALKFLLSTLWLWG